jgi:hypothetical protein
MWKFLRSVLSWDITQCRELIPEEGGFNQHCGTSLKSRQCSCVKHCIYLLLNPNATSIWFCSWKKVSLVPHQLKNLKFPVAPKVSWQCRNTQFFGGIEEVDEFSDFPWYLTSLCSIYCYVSQNVVNSYSLALLPQRFLQNHKTSLLETNRSYTYTRSCSTDTS